MPSVTDAVINRHRMVSVVALVILTALAWLWLIAGAGMGMEPLATFSPFAAREVAMSDMIARAPIHPLMPWSAARFALTFLMWWVMMVAMMLPSAAPTILLYARAALRGKAGARPATESFLGGYLVAWGIFSLAATALQQLLVQVELLAPMRLALESRTFSAALLVSAGVYQLTPLKNMCLRHCRSPAQFLSRRYRPGAVGALRMGLIHGAYCVGCCWLLMALLFVGGVMNLVWIALLTLMVVAEKLTAFGNFISRVIGVVCLIWGAVILSN